MFLKVWPICFSDFHQLNLPVSASFVADYAENVLRRHGKKTFMMYRSDDPLIVELESFKFILSFIIANYAEI